MSWHVARYGDDAGGHALLAATDTDAAAARDAAYYTDLPPHDNAREPIIAGYAVRSHYVVQRTVADPTASRAGMVQTTALFLAEDAPLPDDLVAVIAAIPTGDLRPATPASAPATPHVHAPGAAALIDALIDHGRAVWTGPGLIEALACTWFHLDEQHRRRLVFGRAFAPSTVHYPLQPQPQSLLVVATPPQRLAHWAGWPAVRADASKATSVAQSVLEGIAPPMIAGLLDRAERPPLRDLRDYATLSERLAGLNTANLTDAASAAHLLGLLAPEPTRASAAKQRVLERLAAVAVTSPYRDIRPLRTVPWERLTAPAADAATIAAWARAAVADPARSSDIAAALAAPAGDDWAAVVAAAVLAAARAAPDAAAAHVAALAALSDGAAAEALAGAIPAKVADTALSDDSVPRSPAIAELGRRYGWPRTHARHAAATAAAILDHLRTRGRTSATLHALTTRARAADVVTAAAAADDGDLDAAAAATVAADPAALRVLTPADDRARRVWAAAIDAGADPWSALDPADAAPVLLDAVTSGERVPRTLLDALSRTSAADISTRPDRAQLWPLLPTSARDRMLKATAAAIAPTRPAPADLEPPLRDALLTRDALRTLAAADAGAAVGLLRLATANASHAILVAEAAQFDAATANELGIIVRDRRWNRAADWLLDNSRDRPDLAAAVAPAAKVLHPVGRLVAAVAGLLGSRPGAPAPDVDEARRDALLAVAVELYPAGPDDRHLWSRAGGEDADAPTGSTGRTKWQAAVTLIETGARGAPSLADVIEMMTQDYPGNAHLRRLAETLGLARQHMLEGPS